MKGVFSNKSQYFLFFCGISIFLILFFILIQIGGIDIFLENITNTSFINEDSGFIYIHICDDPKNFCENVNQDFSFSSEEWEEIYACGYKKSAGLSFFSSAWMNQDETFIAQGPTIRLVDGGYFCFSLKESVLWTAENFLPSTLNSKEVLSKDRLPTGIYIFAIRENRKYTYKVNFVIE